ncbi:MAG: DUF2793 domain-containing protein, partial [Chloroflexi bacterium]|nr:DUF2793 domain-containing protein [Chloroflexota bacterium]
FLSTGNPTLYYIKGFKIYSSTANTACAFCVGYNSYISFGFVDIGAGFSQQIRAQDGGYIACLGNYTISGGAAVHCMGVLGIIRIQSVTITLVGTPAFSGSFIDCGFLSDFIMNAITFSGSATGVRYSVTANSVLYTNSGGANYFPGSTAGSTATGGQYT